MARIPEAELPFVQRVILRCVREEPGRFPRSVLAKLLVGSDSRHMQEFYTTIAFTAGCTATGGGMCFITWTCFCSRATWRWMGMSM